MGLKKSQQESPDLDGAETTITVETLPNSTELHLHKLIIERYQIEKELGRGGFGIAFLARDKQLHLRPVVIKLLLSSTKANTWINKKFLQEIEALTRINHPGIVNLIDAGETEDGNLFIVKQYVEGDRKS